VRAFYKFDFVSSTVPSVKFPLPFKASFLVPASVYGFAPFCFLFHVPATSVIIPKFHLQGRSCRASPYGLQLQSADIFHGVATGRTSFSDFLRTLIDA